MGFGIRDKPFYIRNWQYQSQRSRETPECVDLSLTTIVVRLTGCFLQAGLREACRWMTLIVALLDTCCSSKRKGLWMWRVNATFWTLLVVRYTSGSCTTNGRQYLLIFIVRVESIHREKFIPRHKYYVDGTFYTRQDPDFDDRSGGGVRELPLLSSQLRVQKQPRLARASLNRLTPFSAFQTWFCSPWRLLDQPLNT